MSPTERSASDFALFMADVTSFERHREHEGYCPSCDRKMVYRNGYCIGCNGSEVAFDSKPIDRREVSL